MKIYSEYKPNESGKGKFLSRLFPELSKLRCKIQFEPEGADVRLALTRLRTKVNLPTVLRMDGIHLEKTKKTIWNNNRVKESIKKVDAVIYQTKFAQDMVEKILKVTHPFSSVIFNGADPDSYPKTQYKPVDVVMVANWANRRHKRLTDMLKIAEITPELFFSVCGKIDHEVNKPDNVNFLGPVNEERLKLVLAESKIMLNLAEFDWCPNAVVEALVAGVIVVCLEGTGISEIVKDNGVHIYRDRPFNPKEAGKGRFCQVNHKYISELLLRLVKNYNFTQRGDLGHLHIKNIASQYYQVFRSVLCKR